MCLIRVRYGRDPSSQAVVIEKNYLASVPKISQRPAGTRTTSRIISYSPVSYHFHLHLISLLILSLTREKIYQVNIPILGKAAVAP